MCLHTDRELEWIGSDVARRNYQAALLSEDVGVLKVISTWNARANPYVQPNYMKNSHEVLDRIDRLGINWIIGTRWDRRDLPQDNNRMHMHPPGNALILGLWLSFFQQTHFWAFVYELFVKYFLIVIAIFWSWKFLSPEEPLNRTALALLIATSIPTLITIIPHANELATLLALIALIFGCTQNTSNQFPRYMLSGVFLGLAIYVNFCYLFLALSVFTCLLCSKEARRSWLPLALSIGSFIVILLFFSLGYYPWLTYLTGSQVDHYYRLSKKFYWVKTMLGYVSISIPLLLATTLSFFQFNSIKRGTTKAWMIGAVIGLLIYAIVLFPYPASRYLIGYFYLILPLLCVTLHKLQLTKSQILMIPLVNFLCVILILILRSN